MMTHSASLFISSKILRLHGVSLIVAGVILVTGASLGYYANWGVLSFLADNPLAYLGLIQAYLLMAIIGYSLNLITEHLQIRKWHLIAFIAHIPPLAMTIIFWDLFVQMDKAYMPYSGLIAHLAVMSVELYAYYAFKKPELHWFKRWSRSIAKRA